MGKNTWQNTKKDTEKSTAENTRGTRRVEGEAHEEFHEAAEAPHAGEGQPPTSARISEQPRARFQRPMRRGGRPQRGGRRPGGRPHQAPQHGHPRHEQHRRPQLISEMLKAGEEIIVQIAKEPLGKKGARITSHVALPGRFLVYMPTVDHVGVSRRIGSAEDRSRLRRLVNEAKGTFPGGFIVRTAAVGSERRRNSHRRRIPRAAPGTRFAPPPSSAARLPCSTAT